MKIKNTSEQFFTKNGDMRLTVVIPAYNEAEIIPLTLNTLDRVLSRLPVTSRIVLVDDGSQDKTALEASRVQIKVPIQIIRHPRNLGPGAAFNTGLTAALKASRPNDMIVTLEADNTSDPHLISRMVSLIGQGHDVVCASRYLHGGGYRDFPFLRTIYSRCSNYFLRLLFPIPRVTDYTIFFRAYRAAVLKRAQKVYRRQLIEFPGFVGNAEILIKICRLGASAAEVPLVYAYKHRQGKSRMKVARNILEYLKFISRNWRLR